MVHFYTEAVSGHVRRICGNGDVCMYLVEGSERALLIDTGYGVGDLRGYVEGLLGEKPYDVALTHGHIDHAAGASEFESCFMSPLDNDIYEEFCSLERRHAKIDASAHSDFRDVVPEDYAPVDVSVMRPLAEGDTFDLGDVHVEMIAVPGHTPGTMVPLVVEEGIALFGDACGVGTLIMLPHSTTVERYRESLLHLKGYEDRYAIVLRQHGTCVSTKRVLEDNLELCDLVLAGKDAAEPTEHNGAPCLRAGKTDPATGRRADGREGNLLYLPDRIR
ncbi:MAG TPA: MBL fold metallo-hydrolase [Candidatus Olsenella pullicola]|nr:MBL fold metallo-hydrolase [Candidatus Olsenella pullicola]